jgi:hypothetical protein
MPKQHCGVAAARVCHHPRASGREEGTDIHEFADQIDLEAIGARSDGGRFVLSITSVPSDIAAAVKCFRRGTDAGRSAGMEIIAEVQAQLDGLDERFQKEFEEEFSATLHGDVSLLKLNARAQTPARTTATH